MKEPELRNLFLRALTASLAFPLAAGVASCSSSSNPAHVGAVDGATADTGRRDSGKDAAKEAAPGHDAKTHASASGEDAGLDGGVDSAATSEAGSGDASGHDAGVDAKPRDGGRTDATEHDADRRDAREDAGTDAKPDMYVNCTLPPEGPSNFVPVPAACVDGGVPGSAAYDCTAYCPGDPSQWCACMILPNEAGAATLDCYFYCEGRAHAGMAPLESPGQTTQVGRFLARAAHMEASSVDAFRILRDELQAHGAPADLTVAAEAALRDEVRHARVTRRLARRHGPVTPHRRAAARPVRPLVDVALENAVEGCVRETYAALVARHQAVAATDAEVREAMVAIAEDETRHAALAWEVAAWADARLDADGRRRVAEAKALAVKELRAELEAGVPSDLVSVLGLPAGERATRMLAALEEELWGSA